jgi:hypothetical protein
MSRNTPRMWIDRRRERICEKGNERGQEGAFRNTKRYTRTLMVSIRLRLRQRLCQFLSRVRDLDLGVVDSGGEPGQFPRGGCRPGALLAIFAGL